MLDFAPDRLGHCVLLDDANLTRLLARGGSTANADRPNAAAQIPVEACLTCHEKHFGVPK